MPLHPFLFAAYAVLFLFSQNLDEVTLRDAIPLVGRAIIGAGLVTIIPALVLRDARRGAIVGSALVAAFFGYGHLATNLADAGYGTDVLHAMVIAVVTLAIVLAVWLRRDPAVALSQGLDVVAVILVALALVAIVPHEAGRAALASTPVPGRGAPHAGDRDIYWLILDRYGSSDSLRRYNGIENDLPAWLEEQGFHVAEDSKSNYIRTTLIMATVLRMDYLTDIVEQQPVDSNDLGPAYRVIEEHRVAQTLRERGYRYVHVGSWFGPTKTHAVADVVPDIETETDFSAVLDDTTIMPAIRDLLLPEQEEIKPSDLLHREYGLFQFRVLEEISEMPGPKFVMAHILLPHMPYVFDEDGDYPDPADRLKSNPERYTKQLVYTNEKVRELVRVLLAGPDERDPIIVIYADEGPPPERYAADLGFDWAIATQDELHTKYGILNAFHFPSDVGPLPDAVGPANTFRLVFSRAFGMDLPLLPERSWTSKSWERPWDMTEITDRLAQP